MIIIVLIRIHVFLIRYVRFYPFGNIRFIDNMIGIDQLPERLREIARLRVEYQDVTLKELGEMVSTGNVSKSGVNHRLRKIDEIAESLRKGEMIGR